MEQLRTEVVVIGAGVVGLTIAYRLASEGREVVIVDPAPPGSGASYGNAGTIADYAVLPVGTPAVLKALPSLLFDRTSPLAIRRAALPSLAPWLVRFALQSLPGPARRNAAALAGLLADAAPRWRDLASEIGAADLLRDRGAMYLYADERALEGARADMAGRRRLGVQVEILAAHEIAQMEPRLPRVAGAAFFPGALSFADPGLAVGRLAEAAEQAGARLVTARADGIERADGWVRVSATRDGSAAVQVRALSVVLAAGAHSCRLAAQAGDRVPLDTERGYHAEWDMEEPLLSRPCCPTARGFYLCPMQGRLRAAGTVELGGLTAPPSQHRIDALVAGARTVFPDLGAPDRTWMGFRPSMPDSLPVIGPSRAGAEVIHAYGHGHIGLTLAPLTAALVADVLAGRGTPTAAVLPGRFR